MRPLIEENAFLQKAMTDTDTAGLKRIEGSYLYLRGMRSPIGIKSVPADMIVFDELDEATPDAKTRAKERLSHSSYKRVIELSNPSIPDFGIDEAFQRQRSAALAPQVPRVQRMDRPGARVPTDPEHRGAHHPEGRRRQRVPGLSRV